MFPDFRQVLTAEFLICCPHRNPIYPPTPVEPGDVVEEESVKGKRTCGQVQVHLGEENNNPVVPGNETDLEEGATRIVGGREAKMHEFPWIVSTGFDLSLHFITFISRKNTLNGI